MLRIGRPTRLPAARSGPRTGTGSETGAEMLAGDRPALPAQDEKAARRPMATHEGGFPFAEFRTIIFGALLRGFATALP